MLGNWSPNRPAMPYHFSWDPAINSCFGDFKEDHRYGYQMNELVVVNMKSCFFPVNQTPVRGCLVRQQPQRNSVVGPYPPSVRPEEHQHTDNCLQLKKSTLAILEKTALKYCFASSPPPQPLDSAGCCRKSSSP